MTGLLQIIAVPLRGAPVKPVGVRSEPVQQSADVMPWMDKFQALLREMPADAHIGAVEALRAVLLEREIPQESTSAAHPVQPVPEEPTRDLLVGKQIAARRRHSQLWLPPSLRARILMRCGEPTP